MVGTPGQRTTARGDQLQELVVQSIYLGKTKDDGRARKVAKLPTQWTPKAKMTQGGSRSRHLSLQQPQNC